MQMFCFVDDTRINTDELTAKRIGDLELDRSEIGKHIAEKQKDTTKGKQQSCEGSIHPSCTF